MLIKDVINNSDFSGYGRLIFPVDIRSDDDLTLQDTEGLMRLFILGKIR